MEVILIYYSKTGHTVEAAEAVIDGIKSTGSGCRLLDIAEFEPDMLKDYDALIVGSPCWAGSEDQPGIPFPVKNILNTLPEDLLSSTRCGAFTVHAIAGGGKTIRTLDMILAEKGCQDFIPGPAVRAGTPFSVTKGSSVKPQELEKLEAYGREFIKGT